MSVLTETLTLEEVLEVTGKEHELILHNDDFNTFDFVIDTLVELCDHDSIQAEQCAWFVHFKGKCAVKSGELSKMSNLCQEMLRRGLSATVN